MSAQTRDRRLGLRAPDYNSQRTAAPIAQSQVASGARARAHEHTRRAGGIRSLAPPPPTARPSACRASQTRPVFFPSKLCVPLLPPSFFWSPGPARFPPLGPGSFSPQPAPLRAPAACAEGGGSMLSPQRAVAAASGGAGEVPNCPRPRRPPDYSSEETARPHRRPFGPGACTARPCPGYPRPRLRGRGLVARIGRGRRLGSRLGAAAFGGRALRAGEARSARRLVGRAGGVPQLRPRRPRPGRAARAPGLRPPSLPGTSLARSRPGIRGPREREGRWSRFSLWQGAGGLRSLGVGSFIFVLTTSRR